MLLAVSGAIALLVCEGVLRIVRPQTLGIWAVTRDGVTIHQPDLEAFLVEYGQDVRINSKGMRDRELPTSKSPDALRVVVLGDSFMEALQVDFEDSFPVLLEKELAARTGRAVETLNMSVSGWGTDDELTYFDRYGQQTAPDLVLVAMTLHNDLQDNMVMEFHEFDGTSLRERPRELIPWSSFLLLRAKAWFSSHSHLYRLAYLTYKSRDNQAAALNLRSHVAALVRSDQTGEADRGWAMTHKLLDKLEAKVAGSGGQLAVFLIPLSMQVDPGVYTDFLQRHSMLPTETSPDLPQRRALEWGRESGVQVIDLRPAFEAASDGSAETLHVVEDGHWNEAGHALAATVVARELSASAISAGR